MVEHLLVHVLLLDALRADCLSKFDLKNHIDFQDFQDFAWNWNKISWIWRCMCSRSASRGRTCTGAVFWSVLLKCFWNINPDVCCFETLKLWNFSLEFRKKCSEHRFENEKSRLNQAITRKIAKNNEKSMKKISKIGKKISPYMHPICALYTPYMHPIWRTYLARARARAPGPRRRGASGPYPQKRVKLFPHARAPANGFLFQFGFNHFS